MKPDASHDEARLAPQKKALLQSIIAALYYLSAESEREHLGETALILREAIGKIDMRLNQAENQSGRLADHSLYEVMNFMHKLLAFTPENRQEFVTLFTTFADGNYAQAPKRRKPVKRRK